MVKSELLHCSPTCTWICCSQLAKGVPLATLLPVVAFVTSRNTPEQFKVFNFFTVRLHMYFVDGYLFASYLLTFQLRLFNEKL
jgi:hypothetical protein